ncbi:MAG: hypothetical protein LBE33_05650 [Zoogloeaceae bacterium]|jgi:sulfate adenylyltransferase subunit 1|nr:hypothetical protein [Zoogloeaceae bacterium]
MDMVDYDQARFEEIAAKYRAFTAQLDLHDVHCIPLSALNGDMFTREGTHAPRVEKEFEATLCWLAETPLDRNRKYLIKHTTRMAKCLFSRLDFRVDVNTLEQHPTDKLNMNDIARVAMKTAQPLVFDSYADDRATGSFIIIDEASNNTVAAGMIVQSSLTSSAQ